MIFAVFIFLISLIF